MIYLSIRFIFCLCFIVDDNCGPIESLRQSLTITRNHFFKLIALVLLVFVFVALVLMLINAIITYLVPAESHVIDYMIDIAAICWFAIAFPTVQVMIIATYRKLVYSTKDIDDDVSETL
uniref:glycerophosphoryl diester phosphodiesterase membrane domain-containing protein n=1 Tax=Mucilaginibacter sp. Bleaf8 TaxID=2834430 RepID=UPI0024BE5946|nr:glycerophosphoryl diester phosphodiesterase membrane domain-containing protein [Mucilaginibacter sp. Bleaf8]